jgi:hypothetical protein
MTDPKEEVLSMAVQDKTGPLTVQQENAIDLLIQGRSDREAADAVGVARQTVTGWRNENPDFVAELNRRRQEVWGGQVEQLKHLVARAVQVLAEDLDDVEDKALRQRAAVHILRAVGLYGANLAPAGATDSEAIKLEWAKEQHMKNTERMLYAS